MQCPSCAEAIADDAKVCRYCGRKTKKAGNWLFYIGVFFALILIAHAMSGLQTQGSNSMSAPTPTSPIDPNYHDKEVAAALAKMEVPKAMKDPSSAQFGNVWGMTKDIACGFVNGKNSFGALTGQQRFIFVMGQTEFEDQSNRFAKHWNTLCVAKLLSGAPTGASGKRWGSGPTDDLKPSMPTTGDGLRLYVPKEGAASLEGIRVKEADYRYDHRRLYAADFYLVGEANREAIKMALAKKYGTPQDYDEAAHSYKWSWPGRRVTVEMSYQDSTKLTTVTYAQGDH